MTNEPPTGLRMNLLLLNEINKAFSFYIFLLHIFNSFFNDSLRNHKLNLHILYSLI